MSFLVIDPYKERLARGIIILKRYLEKENFSSTHNAKDYNAITVAIDGIK